MKEGMDKMVIRILVAIVKDLRKRGILTEVLTSAGIDPIDWSIFQQEQKPFADE